MAKLNTANQTNQKIFYDKSKFKNLKDLETKIQMWTNEYNNLEQHKLNELPPNEYLKLSN